MEFLATSRQCKKTVTSRTVLTADERLNLPFYPHKPKWLIEAPVQPEDTQTIYGCNQPGCEFLFCRYLGGKERQQGPADIQKRRYSIHYHVEIFHPDLTLEKCIRTGLYKKIRNTRPLSRKSQQTNMDSRSLENMLNEPFTDSPRALLLKNNEKSALACRQFVTNCEVSADRRGFYATKVDEHKAPCDKLMSFESDRGGRDLDQQQDSYNFLNHAQAAHLRKIEDCSLILESPKVTSPWFSNSIRFAHYQGKTASFSYQTAISSESQGINREYNAPKVDRVDLSTTSNMRQASLDCLFEQQHLPETLEPTTYPAYTRPPSSSPMQMPAQLPPLQICLPKSSILSQTSASAWSDSDVFTGLPHIWDVLPQFRDSSI